MIVGAAVKRGEHIWTGWCHSTVIEDMGKIGACSVDDPVRQDEQGFVNSAGDFLDRNEAFKDAVKSGQIDNPKDGKEHRLFSEDLWWRV